MPLDGHAYLVSQGWAGKGSGLRHGAVSRPVVLAQKKTLSGIGKDRDEAFPFWDHVFNAAACAVKIKVYDSDSEDTDSSSSGLNIERTSTGLISNRRPTTGTPALSGTATPTSESSSSCAPSRSITPKISVMTAAKQAAAKRTLYSMFFRGPVLASEFEQNAAVAGKTMQSDEKVEEAVVEVTEVLEDVEIIERTERKKRKREQVEDEEEHKQLKREKKGKERALQTGGAEEGGRREKKRKNKEGKLKEDGKNLGTMDNDRLGSEDLTKAERKRLTAEKRARKEKRQRKDVEVEIQNDASHAEDNSSTRDNKDAAKLQKKRSKDGRERKKDKRKTA